MTTSTSGLAANLSWSTEQLIEKTGQKDPWILIKGSRLELKSISLPKALISSVQECLEAFGKTLKKSQVCLLPIPVDSVQIEKTAPLTFKVVKRLALHTASLNNWREAPFNRFTFNNVASLLPVAHISRRKKEPIPLLKSKDGLSKSEIEKTIYKDWTGQQKTFINMLEKIQADGIVILRNGKTVYEKYFGDHTESKPHILYSVTKSLLALVVVTLIQEKIIDPDKKIKEYIPELKASAFGDARVVELLDMTTGVKFNEDYLDKDSEMAVHFIAGGYDRPPEGYKGPRTLRSFLPKVQKQGEHNAAFHYVSNSR